MDNLHSDTEIMVLVGEMISRLTARVRAETWRKAAALHFSLCSVCGNGGKDKCEEHVAFMAEAEREGK